MKLALIGNGAIAQYVSRAAIERGHSIVAVLVRSGREAEKPGLFISDVEALPVETDLVIDCAGHEALAAYGPRVLRQGFAMVTVSIGALGDQKLIDELESAAQFGNARLHLASGAIGGLDCLKAASVGELDTVTYIGRKPPIGWKGSPAEASLDLDILSAPATHFEGSAREAALKYPKNANVAAAVALAGMGMDATKVELIADPDINQNMHEIEAAGDFGTMRFQISGNSLPENPRSSALAAMSVVAKLEELSAHVVI